MGLTRPYDRDPCCVRSNPYTLGPLTIRGMAVESSDALVVSVLDLFVDTSTWLDLAKRRDGQRLIRLS